MSAKKKPAEKKPKQAKASAAPKADKAAKASGKGDTKVERFRQNMRCELSAEEIGERSKRIAHQLSEKAIRMEAAKSATAHIKAEIKQIDADISRTAQEINDGATYREVECERRFIYRTGKVVEVRMDNDEQTFERPMSFAERQLDLIPKGANSKGAKVPEETTKVLQEAADRADGEDASDPPGSDEAPESNPGDVGQGDADEDQDDDAESAAE